MFRRALELEMCVARSPGDRNFTEIVRGGEERGTPRFLESALWYPKDKKSRAALMKIWPHHRVALDYASVRCILNLALK